MVAENPRDPDAHRRQIDLYAILQGERISNSGYPIEIDEKPAQVYIKRANVDDDGTFDSETGNVALFFIIAEDVESLIPHISAEQVISALQLEKVYVYSFDTEVPIELRFGTFFSSSGDSVDAPSDFDWRKYSQRFFEFSVYRKTKNNDETKLIYQLPNVRPYFPYMDRRGRFWEDVRVKYPDKDSKTLDAFNATLGVLSRRSAISNDIRLVALESISEGKAALVLERMKSGRCFSIEIEVPTHSQIQSGRFFIPSSIAPIAGPVQFAAELLSVLQERSAGWTSMGGEEIECGND